MRIIKRLTQLGTIGAAVVTLTLAMTGTSDAVAKTSSTNQASASSTNYWGNVVNRGAPDKCIGISDGLAGDWYCTGNPDQNWHWDTSTILYTSAGTYMELVNGNGQCLAVNGGVIANGSRIIGYPCVGSDDQYWLYVAGSWEPLENFKGYFSTSHPGQGPCLVGVGGGSTANGAALVLWTPDGSLNQYWWVLQQNEGY